ncbi:MAG: trypsin-like peptidase domain-containing protein, partial [Clostridia bacterium]|nr:trypsin-like peptidase domain-containing protein [Clostridia bacterium]
MYDTNDDYTGGVNNENTNTNENGYGGFDNNAEPTAPAAGPEEVVNTVDHSGGHTAENADNGSADSYAEPAQKDPYNGGDQSESESAYSPYSGSYSDNYYQRYNDSYREHESKPYYTHEAASSAEEEPKKKKKSKGFKAFIIALVAVLVCVAIVLVGANVFKFDSKTSKVQNSSGDSTQLILNESPSSSKTSLDTENIAENAKKFNVGILLYGKTQTFSLNASGNSLVGEGSGIIMKEDSTKTYTYILTCAHVISGVKTSGYTMTVQDYEGNTYDGILVGYDEKTDVGVIKIKATGLNCAEFGDSSKLKIGQKIYTIGNPGGTEFFGSFSDGLVSSIDRPISSESGYEMNCIQHTAAINTGNSGGALLNEYGQVIGINSSKIVSTGYEGMAFAIPITDAQTVINDIISNGYVTNRPKLGISYSTVSNYQIYSMVVKLKELPSGSLIIAKISSDSSLANTDAKVGDLIIAVDGEKMDKPNVLLEKIQNGKVGDKLKLTLCRISSNDYSVSTFNVTATLVEDTGNSESADEEQTTTQNYWEQYFNNGF